MRVGRTDVKPLRWFGWTLTEAKHLESPQKRPPHRTSQYLTGWQKQGWAADGASLWVALQPGFGIRFPPSRVCSHCAYSFPFLFFCCAGARTHARAWAWPPCHPSILRCERKFSFHFGRLSWFWHRLDRHRPPNITTEQEAMWSRRVGVSIGAGLALEEFRTSPPANSAIPAVFPYATFF